MTYSALGVVSPSYGRLASINRSDRLGASRLRVRRRTGDARATRKVTEASTDSNGEDKRRSMFADFAPTKQFYKDDSPASKTTAGGNDPKEVTEEAPAIISQDWFDKLRVEKAAV